MTDYLFDDPAPERVSAEWIACVAGLGIREDPGFVLSWDEDDAK